MILQGGLSRALLLGLALVMECASALRLHIIHNFCMKIPTWVLLTYPVPLFIAIALIFAPDSREQWLNSQQPVFVAIETRMY